MRILEPVAIIHAHAAVFVAVLDQEFDRLRSVYGLYYLCLCPSLHHFYPGPWSLTSSNNTSINVEFSFYKCFDNLNMLATF